MTRSSPVRVLVVDDSPLVRRLITRAIEDDPEVEVCATAGDGEAALRALKVHQVDLVTLDVEMPRMNGLETLREIRAISARLPVIMFSTLTLSGSAATMEALANGASDYVSKPSGGASLDAAAVEVRTSLLPKIKALCPPRGRPNPVPRHAAPAPIAKPATSAGLQRAVAPKIVAIGVSTGGPAALEKVFAALPKELEVPVVVVQHMPAAFTSLLAQRLNNCSPLDVAEATEGGALKAGKAWVARGDNHLIVNRSGGQASISLTSGPPENSCRPAVDVLFRSLAQAYGPEVLAVVMTGMGNDGLKGARAIIEAGGRVLAQDEATSVVWGMPGLIAKAGLAEAVLALDDIAGAISQRVGRVRIPRPAAPVAASNRTATTSSIANPPSQNFGHIQSTSRTAL